MTHRIAIATFSIFLVFSFGMPAGLLISPPPKAHATLPVIDASILPQSIISAIQTTLRVIGGIADYALQTLFYIKEWVLQPLAYITSGDALKALTAGMLEFVVDGDVNGTGRPIFITNLPKHLQGVGDVSAAAFTNQFRARIDSPYAGVIVSSLDARYASRTTLDGFFSTRRNTLPGTQADQAAYLAGDWSKGGIVAWLSLTTQPENNPYALYQDSQRQLGLMVANAQETHEQIVSWGEGFMSWCAEDPDYDPNTPTDGDADGVSANSPCTREDGTPGIIQTPGTTITKYLDKALTIEAEKTAQLGDASAQISDLIGSITEVVSKTQTVIGVGGGLAGVFNDEGGGSRSDGYKPDSDYGGLSQCSINASLAERSPTNGQDLLDRLPDYLAAWEAIGEAAAGAETEVTRLVTWCSANATKYAGRATFVNYANALVAEANKALNKGPSDGILYLVDRAEEAPDVADNAVETVTSTIARLRAPGEGDPPVCEDLSNEALQLNQMAPTARDMANAQQGAMITNNAVIAEGTYLTLVPLQGSLVDKMALLESTAKQLYASCNGP